MRRAAITPPVARHPAARPDPEKTKTFLRRKKPTQFADSSDLPLVGPEATKIPLERNLSPASSLAHVQAHPSMRICLSRPLIVRMRAMAEKQSDAKPAETFEKSLDELEKVVRELEGGDLSLDRSLLLFERGMELSGSCRKQLEAAETRVDMLTRKEGKMTAEPFRPEKSGNA